MCVCVCGAVGRKLSEEQHICILTPPAFFSYLIPWQQHLCPLGKRWEKPCRHSRKTSDTDYRDEIKPEKEAGCARPINTLKVEQKSVIITLRDIMY